MSALAGKIDTTRAAYGFQVAPIVATKSYKPVLIGGPTSSSVNTEDLFRELAGKWRRETAHMSFVAYRLQHPAYLRILSMGRSVVPLILREMERQPDHWFYALVQLTGKNPVPADFNGTVTEAAEIWVHWGKKEYAT